jgi:hypothetical protein
VQPGESRSSVETRSWNRSSKTSPRISSAGAGISASARRRGCSQTWKHGYAGDYVRISGGSGGTALTASRNYAAVACRSSSRRPQPAHPPDFGVCRHTRRCSKPCATMFSTISACPGSTLPQRINPVEPPRYGPVCQVVWEGRRREASPYPDQSMAARNAQGDKRLPWVPASAGTAVAALC